MRVAALLLLAAAAPAEACMGHMTPGEQMLMMASSMLMLGTVVAWGLGLLAYGWSMGRRGRSLMALATLSTGILEAAVLAVMPLGSSRVATHGGQQVAGATLLVMCAVAPLLAWRAIHVSQKSGGQVVARAGSPLFPLAMLASFAFANAEVTFAAVSLAFTPLLSLFFVLGDRAAELQPAGPVLSPLKLAPGQCPVCRVLVRDRVERCARCQTAHHQECLAFNGRCGIFGCQPGAPDPSAKKKPEVC